MAAQARFLQQAVDLTLGDLSLGAGPLGGGHTKLSIALCFRHPTTNWISSGSHALVAKNTTGQRAFLIQTIAEGGLGQIQIAFGTGTTLTSAYVPDNTCVGRFWHTLGVSFNTGTVLVVIDGRTITLQNASGAWPVAIGASSAPLVIGASPPGSNRFGGLVANVGLWPGTALSEYELRQVWNDFDPPDYRKLTLASSPQYYIVGNGSSADVMAGATVTPSGTVLHTASPIYPRRSLNSRFRRRVMLNVGNEQSSGPWPAGVNSYSSNPALLRLPTGELLMTYSRGTSHDDLHVGYIARSPDDGVTWPYSGRDHPYTAAATTALLPHGNLSSATTPKRGFALSLIPGIGAAGADRIFCTFVEAQIVGAPVTRRIYLMYSDDGAVTWSAPIDCGGSGTNFNSIGRARVVQSPDGSLLMPYYRQNDGETRYTSSVLRSADAGLSWSHIGDIAHDASGIGGLQYEEPHIQYLRGTDTLMAMVRVDSTRDVLRNLSTDHGVTWTTPVKVLDGWGAPSWVETTLDGVGSIMLTAQRHDDVDPSISYGELYLSRDQGASWSRAFRISDRSDDLFLYPGLEILGTGEVGLAVAQEWSVGGAFLEFGVLDPKALRWLAS